MLVTAAVPRFSEAASPQLPPAEYRPLPVGTILEYDTWTCEVVRSEGFRTTCRDPEYGTVGFYGVVENFGPLHRHPHFSQISLIACRNFQNLDGGIEWEKVSTVTLNESARAAIENLWPIRVGNTAEFHVGYGGVLQKPRVAARAEVVDTESITIHGINYHTYVVSTQVSRDCAGADRDGYHKTSWYAPKLGFIVKDRLEWLTGYRKGKTSEYKLVNLTFPQDAPVIAQTAPQVPVARPAPLQQPRPQPANKHAVAVIIGNKTYVHGDVPEVSFAHNDAVAIKRYVIDVLGFRERNIIELTDATQADIESTFGNERSHQGKLWREVREGKSDIVVFYSGHGMRGLNDGKSYLLPVNADPATAEINGYPLETLYRNLEKLKPRSALVLIDACFSGASHAGSLIPAGSIITVPRNADTIPQGLTVLTAAGPDQIASWDLEAEFGLFTERFFARGLRRRRHQGLRRKQGWARDYSGGEGLSRRRDDVCRQERLWPGAKRVISRGRRSRPGDLSREPAAEAS